MMKRWTKTGWMLLMGAMLAGAACAPVPPVVPNPCNKQVVTLNIYSDDQLNPTTAEMPRPVVVRLYQLATDLKMLNAPYNKILLKDAEVLGTDLIQVDEVQLFPNDLVRIQFERNPEATMLAGVALFHDPKGQSWKTYYEFPPMPNTPAACGASVETTDPQAPQAFPETEFFLSETRIDNGGQFDESMFPNSTPIRTINLSKRSAAPDSYPKNAPPPAAPPKG
ncbi:MAG: type VI secretion system lipoprotein TssJ [Polyangiaceae bacterium]